MARKTWQEKLEGNPDLPRIQVLTDPEQIRRYGGERMLITSPKDCYRIMKRIPEGRVLTAERLRELLARDMGADFTCPLTVGIFINIAAQAAVEMKDGDMPYWRTLKKEGMLNEKLPGRIQEQAARLRAEGLTVVCRGKNHYVRDYERHLVAID